MKSIIKKITQTVVIASLLITGLIMSPLKVEANEYETRAVVPSMSVISKSYTITGWESPLVDLTINFNYDNQLELMTFKNMTCSGSLSGTTCRLISSNGSGNSQTGSYNTLYVTFVYQVTKVSTGETWEVKYRFDYRQGQLIAKNYFYENEI